MFQARNVNMQPENNANIQQAAFAANRYLLLIPEYVYTFISPHNKYAINHFGLLTNKPKWFIIRGIKNCKRGDFVKLKNLCALFIVMILCIGDVSSAKAEYSQRECLGTFYSGRKELAVYVQYSIVEDPYPGTKSAKITCESNGVLLWKYITPIGLYGDYTEVSNVYFNERTVYFVEMQKLMAMDAETGNIKWYVNGAGVFNIIDFDKAGNIYVSGNPSPDCMVVSKNGKVLIYDDNGDHWSYDYALHDNILKIYYGNDEVKEIDMSEYQNAKLSVFLNGEKVNFDQQPVIQNGRTLVPIRAVVEKMGGSVEWNELTRTTVLKFGANTVKLTIDSMTAYLNEQQKTLDVPPQIINGRTPMPIRFVAESFGFDVDWNAATQSVIIIPENSEYKGLNLLNCIGKTKEEIEGIYGKINESHEWGYGKYYSHQAIKTMLFYEHNNYDVSKIDDVPNYAKCDHVSADLSEFLKTPNKKAYTISELESIFGNCEITDDLDNDLMPICYFRFSYGNYEIYYEGDCRNPQVEYVYIYPKR